MKSKKMTKQPILWAPYSNSPKKNILVSSSSNETNTISNTSILVDSLIINLNLSSFIGYINTVNREALSALLSFSTLPSFSQTSVITHPVGVNMSVAK